MLISELIGRTLTHGSVTYAVTGAVFASDGRRIEKLLLSDGTDTFSVPCDAFRSFDSLETNERFARSVPVPTHSPIGTKLVGESGRPFGTVRDVEIKRERVVRLLLEKVKPLGKARLDTKDDTTVFVRPSRVSASSESPAAAIPFAASHIEKEQGFREFNAHVPILHAVTQNKTESPAPPQDESAQHECDRAYDAVGEQLPARIVADYSFLLGRIVTSDIIAHGEVVIAAGELIRTHTVAVARAHAKLFELTVKSKS